MSIPGGAMDSSAFRLAAYALAVLCTSCANMNSVYHTFDVNNERQSLSIDAKQRVLITGTRGGSVEQRTDNDNKPYTVIFNSKVVVCAEPSPDAFSVLGASFGGSASEAQQLALQLALSTSETGSNIGLRTQSITI